jgi:hypothetical protein
MPTKALDKVTSLIKRKDLEKRKQKFIDDANNFHNYKYDYSKMKYENQQKKVIIICPIHGKFEQTPNNHKKSGCDQCGIDNITNKKEDFVKKAIEKHGDKYDYSKVKYETNREKVIIICPIHGEFKQTPYGHLNGNGCTPCSKEKDAKNKSKDIEKFIEDAKKIHGNKYDYSKIEYENSRTQITIICPIHGEFTQIANDHIQGSGCKQCGSQKPRTTKRTKENIIQDAKKIHGDKYDYSKVIYTDKQTTNSKIKIICPTHGEFEQIVYNHLAGKGCVSCYHNTITGTKEDFVKESIKKHGDKYDYSKVIYKGKKDKVTITCPKHGDFQQFPAEHKRGKGCSKCSNDNRKSKNFIEKSIKIHGDKYDYSKVQYEDTKTKVIIICKIHGDYEQTPSSHLSGCGCNQCAIENKTRTLEEFIKLGKELFDNRYTYENTHLHYKNNTTKVHITCPIHGDFKQTPKHHLRKQGCPQCNLKHSDVQIKWLDFLSSYYKIDIQHMQNGGEFKIPNTNYLADGYCKETNTIYEFDGSFWHGNPKIFNQELINPVNGKTYGELYQKTLEKRNKIKELGYNLVHIWENDWYNLIKIVKMIQLKYKK